MRTRSTGSTSRGKRCCSNRLGPPLAAATAYFGDHPFLTAEAADRLVAQGAALVGIDSHNIDNMHVRARPVHTRCLAPASRSASI